MIAAKIADEANPSDGVVRQRSTSAVLVESSGAPQPEIGVTDRSVDGLGARRDSEKEKPQSHEHQPFHKIPSFRAIARIEIWNGQRGGRARGEAEYVTYCIL